MEVYKHCKISKSKETEILNIIYKKNAVGIGMEVTSMEWDEQPRKRLTMRTWFVIEVALYVYIHVHTYTCITYTHIYTYTLSYNYVHFSIISYLSLPFPSSHPLLLPPSLPSTYPWIHIDTYNSSSTHRVWRFF